MDRPYDPDLAAADEFAEIAFQARRISVDPVLSIDTGNAFRALADAADQLGRIVYAEATGESLPPIRSGPAGAYAARVYDPDSPPALAPIRTTRLSNIAGPWVPPPRAGDDVSVAIEPVTEEGS